MDTELIKKTILYLNKQTESIKNLLWLIKLPPNFTKEEEKLYHKGKLLAIQMAKDAKICRICLKPTTISADNSEKDYICDSCLKKDK